MKFFPSVSQTCKEFKIPVRRTPFEMNIGELPRGETPVSSKFKVRETTSGSDSRMSMATRTLEISK